MPSLSQLMAWPTAHLTEAAEHWEAVGGHRYAVAHEVWREALSVDWGGEAGDALRTATHADMMTTGAVADQLQAAARVARSGASDLYGARSRVRYAVEDARTAGFAVGEDLSVTDRLTGGSAALRAARQAEARAFGGDLRQRASQLVDLDQQVANHTFKQDPPLPPPPYPINEVIAEATDLDGNHVVLGRGYYDASTGTGFGWDKAYWRQGVVNPNVFKDLISHSRPVHQPDGTLRYDVPINRVHCASGPLGIANCQDTGESLTMRIVVDPRITRADVPDGGQKGLITMFPLEGGSGVIELGPKWTWTPPWVNNNVPIN